MRYRLLILDQNNNIIRLADTFEKKDGEIELTDIEYEQALLHNKFNPITRTFSDLKKVEQKIDLIEENRMLKEKVALHEELIFELAMIVYA